MILQTGIIPPRPSLIGFKTEAMALSTADAHYLWAWLLELSMARVYVEAPWPIGPLLCRIVCSRKAGFPSPLLQVCEFAILVGLW